jgi:hypothetical protein
LGIELNKPILESILSENQNLAIILPKAIAREPTFALYFFRVMRRYPLHRTYDSELTEIPAGETVGFNFMGDTGIGSGTDILTVWEERPFRILHFAFGIRPSEIWLYKSIPADTPATGWAYEIEGPKVGDKRDYIPGYLSPYDNPTVATETVLYRKLSVHIGLKNDSGRPIRPSIRILGAGYDTIQITDKKAIEGMLRQKPPCRFFTVGSLRHFTWTVPEEWGPPYIVDKATLERILAGGG